jgi:hypothetical protein
LWRISHKQASANAVAGKGTAVEEGVLVRRSTIGLIGLAKRMGPATPATALADDESSAVKSHVGKNTAAGAASRPQRASVAMQVTKPTVIGRADRDRSSISLAAP